MKTFDNLKENKSVLIKTLYNIDNELGEVKTRIKKTNLLDNELKMKIQNHKDEKTEEKFVELEKLESVKREIEIDLDKMKIEVRANR